MCVDAGQGDGGEGGNGSGDDDVAAGDPTFIQAVAGRPKREQPAATNSGSLFARLSVPYERSLVRANVPIFGVAYGEEFKEYRVEFGEGASPTEWTTISQSSVPQTRDVAPGDLDDSLDASIRGSLGTWDTGLTNYVYLPSHPEGHPIDLKGTYTIRLVVTGNDGSTGEDRVTVDVANVIPNAWGGVASSNDGRVRLIVPKQALMDSFRLILIDAAQDTAPPVAPGRRAIGGIYEVREAGEKFTKGAVLELAFSTEDLGESKPEQLGIYAYEADVDQWQHLKSTRGANASVIRTRLRELHPYYAVMASAIPGEGSTLEPATKDVAASDPAGRPGPREHYLVQNTFEDGLDEWSNRDGEVGAHVAIDREATFDGTGCVKLTNINEGGNFAANVRTTRFDAWEYPVVQFDYRIGADVKTNILVTVSGRWYEIGFTDDAKDVAYRRVNIAHIGDIAGVIADDQWHTARFNLYDMLKTKTGNTIVDEIVLADWDVGGYMKLEFGQNRKGAALYVDNFSISREISRGHQLDSATILLDDFNKRNPINRLSGRTGVFTDSSGGEIRTDFRIDDRPNGGHVMQLSYDLPEANGYAGYVTELGMLDLREDKSLSFALKKSKRDQDFLIGLRDCSGTESKVRGSMFVQGSIADPWQQATIPLAAFSDRLNWACVDQLSICFEHGLDRAGTIAIDDIEFRKVLHGISVDNFAENDQSNLLGRLHTTYTSGPAAINAQHVSNSPNGVLRIAYGGTIGEVENEPFAYAGWRTELGGIDCSKCGNLLLRLRGAEGSGHPNIYLDDGNFRWGVNVADYAEVSDAWRFINIPLDEFGRHGVDLTHVAELQVVFEWERMSGAVLVDDISLGSDRISRCSRFVAQGVAYQPRGFAPGQEDAPKMLERIREDLRVLERTGFSSVVTYGAKGSLGAIPSMAREEGFGGVVIMGIWDPFSAEEWKNALGQSMFVDGYCLGNEGLGLRYEAQELKDKMASLRTASGRPVTTSEPIDRYLGGEFQRVLLSESDWLFPLAHPYWANRVEASEAAEWITARCNSLSGLTNRPIWLKEVGLPSLGANPCNEQMQLEFFEAFESTGLPFFYFEAFDQPWKPDAHTTEEEYWGLFRADGTPKLAADWLKQRAKRR
jgi:exo-beta-1,3-glucanase (GH17 family)